MKRHLFIYILLLSAVFSANAQRMQLRKLSPSVRALYFDQQKRRNNPIYATAKAQEETLLCAFVEATGDVNELFKANRTEVLAEFGDIYIASIPMSRLSNLTADNRIKRIEMGRNMSVLNDQMAKHLNIDDAYKGTRLPQAFTGKDVVMGIQDIGFDLTNPNFYSADMSEYRIKAFWDMLSTDTIGSKYYVGNAYEGKETLLKYAHSRDGLDQNHGSHTLGTAAGSGYGTAYKGIAYDADICLVSNAVSDDADSIAKADQAKYTYATDALGFKYIFDYADSVDKPCVISFSEGSTQDLYGDDILFNEILSKLVGPGKILVASAGNGSLEANYIHKPLGQESAGTFLERWSGPLYNLTTGVRDYTIRLVFYSEKNDTINIPTDWLCQQEDSTFTDTLQIAGNRYILGIGSYPDCYDNDKFVTEVYISGPEKIGMNKTPISLEIIGADTETETYKVMGNFVGKSKNPLLNDGIVYKNINSPGSLPSVICVGSTSYRTGYTSKDGEEMTYNYGQNGERSTFSAIGPAFDGRMKPDVMAPGANIISSTNSYYFEAHPDSKQITDIVSSYEYNGRTYYWKCDTGTSMSSPAVGGAIALWLQANPKLTKEDIIDVFAHTCSHPDETLTYPNNEYGYGQIDVYRGLLYILGIDKIDGISQSQPQKVDFKVRGNDCFEVIFGEPLLKDCQIRVYSTSGQLLKSVVAEEGIASIRVALPAGIKGVIAVQVDGQTPETKGSTLLRL